MGIDPVTLAVTVALNAASMAFSAMRKIEGPRLTDLNVTVADYGTPLNYFYGTRRLELPCFYAEPIKEKKKKRKGKGGKYKEYTYYGTWASMVADHEVTNFDYVWFDRHLIYDRIHEKDIIRTTTGYEFGHYMRFYYGTSTQEADERMLATVEADEGVGTCPAYLDIAYIFFQDVPLEKIGNRFPQVSAQCSGKLYLEEFIPSGGAEVSLDFENGIYTVNGGSRNLADVIEEDLTWGSFSYSDHVAGTGITVNPGAFAIGESNPTFSDEIFNLLGGEFTAVIDVDMSWPTPNVLIDDVSQIWLTLWEPTFADYYEFVAQLRPIVQSVSIGYFHDPDEVFTDGTALASGTHRFAVTISPTQLAYSVDGGEAVTLTPPYTFTATRFSLLLGAGYGSAATVKKIVFYTPQSSESLYRISLVSTETPTLSHILEDVAVRAGMSSDDYDFSALDQEVTGYSWTQGPAKDIIGPLLEIHDSDVRTHGFTLQGLRRGQSLSGADIDSEWFVRSGSDDPLYTVTAIGDTDLPRRITAVFADTNGEQQPNSAVAQRTAVSVATVREMSFDLNTLALSSSDAQALVERKLRREWTGSIKAECKLTPLEILLEPGDVRNLVLDGETMRCSLRRITIGANRVLTTRWERDGATINTIIASPGAEASGRPTPEVYSPVDSQGFVLDIPLITDSHDQTTPFLYIAAGPAVNGTWPGADFWQSDSGTADSFASGWDSVASSDDATWGVAYSSLPDALSSVMDEGSVLVVDVAYGELTSITQEYLEEHADANLALIGSEIIQFRDAVLQSEGGYVITGLLRGCRGTEQHIGTHIGNEDFLLLNSVVKRHDVGAGEIADRDYYKVGTPGFNITETDAIEIVYSAASNRPYSPAHVELTRDTTTGDWNISWVRRTRIGGSTVNGQDVPLGETSESYRVKVLEGSSGGDVVRTITATTEEATYTAAQQIADWGFLRDSLFVQIMQMSPVLSLEGYVTEAYAEFAEHWWSLRTTGTGASQNITLPYSGLADASIFIFVNGIRYETDEYSIAGNVLTMTANVSGDSIEITGMIPADGASWWSATAVSTGASQGVTLPYSALTDAGVLVFVNGIRYETDEYSIAGTTLTLTTNAAGDSIEIIGTVSAGNLSWSSITATGTGASQNIALPYSGIVDSAIFVFVNGIRYETDEYSITGAMLTMTANTAGDSIEIALLTID